MALHVVGVRHHSPACSRLVRETILRVRPRFVLIEGPSDMNDRMEELLLPHDLPVALFTFRQDEAGASRGTWSPFCDYSPEWIAMHAAVEVSAAPLFIYLPAWDPVFDDEENRYSDRHVRHSDRLAELCARLGFEDTDALWDHLFEQPQSEAELAENLTKYFDQLRGDEPGGTRDGPREEFMCRYIAWAMSQSRDADVVVVCGGYHKPALEREWERASRENGDALPTLTMPDRTRIGSYLVPFSFRRLDSFAGYASGMPSPGFYQMVWEEGLDFASDAMLFDTILHLRAKQQRVSPADAIAASTLASGLALLRGHRAIARIDVLDGLAGALVKDALEAPLPWTRRGVLSSRTEPLLAEIVSAFSGKKIGKLAEGTPRPPLLDDAFAELERAGVTLSRKSQKFKAQLTKEDDARMSAVLHRFRVLQIPGFSLLRSPVLSRKKTDLSEDWSVIHSLETDPALIEAALYGATLEGAASAKLEEQSRDATDVRVLASVLVDAALCGIRGLTKRGLADIARLVAHEPSFDAIGVALAKLLSLRRGDLVLGERGQAELADVLVAVFDRGLWLFEGIRGASAPLDMGHVNAVRALRDTVKIASNAIAADHVRAREVCERRTNDAEAPPALRGAALGFLWSTRDPDDPSDAPDEARAIAVLRSVARPESFGDFLGGLFSLAREEVVRAEQLIATIDASITTFLQEDFMIAIPALRQAFEFFPPRERLAIAESLLRISGQQSVDPAILLRAPVDAGVVQRGAAIDRDATVLARRFGLTDSHAETLEKQP